MIYEFHYVCGMETTAFRILIKAGCMAFALAIMPASSVLAAELAMFERDGCIWCVRWHNDIGGIYDRTPEGLSAPLRRINVRDEPGFALEQPVIFTPTFVVVENGREIGRITGYPGQDAFWGLLSKLLPAKSGPSPSTLQPASLQSP
jgi:hypothetical protein